MNHFSFRTWLTEYGDLFWEGVRDLASLPMDNVDLEPIDPQDESEFEEEEFDRDAAWDSCSDAGDYIDYDDYLDEPIYDDPSEDENFDFQSVEDWEEENPEPELDSFKSEEEYDIAHKEWSDARDEIENDYEQAVKKWVREMERRKEAAYDAAQEARDEAVSDCVDERQREHEEEQERLRRQHAEENEPNTTNSGYTGKFTVGNDRFTVGLDRETMSYEGMRLQNIFSVTFEGPNGYSLTRKNSGGEAREKYNHLLAAVAKMVNLEKQQGREVNGFTFYPADPAMGLMYQKFYTDYLQPAGYLRVDPKLYLLKDYIREILKGKPEYMKKSAYSSMTRANRQVRDELEQVRANKGMIRSALLMMQKFVGNVVLFREPYSNSRDLLPGLVTNVTTSSYRNEPEANILADKGGSVYPLIVTHNHLFNVAPDPDDPKRKNVKLTPLGTPLPNMVIPLLQKIASSPSVLASVDSTHFRKLLASYGIQVPDQPKAAPEVAAWASNQVPATA